MKKILVLCLWMVVSGSGTLVAAAYSIADLGFDDPGITWGALPEVAVSCKPRFRDVTYHMCRAEGLGDLLVKSELGTGVAETSAFLAAPAVIRLMHPRNDARAVIVAELDQAACAGKALADPANEYSDGLNAAAQSTIAALHASPGDEDLQREATGLQLRLAPRTHNFCLSSISAGAYSINRWPINDACRDITGFFEQLPVGVVVIDSMGGPVLGAVSYNPPYAQLKRALGDDAMEVKINISHKDGGVATRQGLLLRGVQSGGNGASHLLLALDRGEQLGVELRRAAIKEGELHLGEIDATDRYALPADIVLPGGPYGADCFLSMNIKGKALTGSRFERAAVAQVPLTANTQNALQLSLFSRSYVLGAQATVVDQNGAAVSAAQAQAAAAAAVGVKAPPAIEPLMKAAVPSGPAPAPQRGRGMGLKIATGASALATFASGYFTYRKMQQLAELERKILVLQSEQKAVPLEMNEEVESLKSWRKGLTAATVASAVMTGILLLKQR